MSTIEIQPRSGKRYISLRELTAIQRIAHRQVARYDIYHHLRQMGWFPFFALLAAVYLILNLIFGFLYLAQPGSIADMQPGSIADAFFFSTATVAGIGSGNMHTATLYGNSIQTGEVMLHIGLIPIVIALIIDRFSRPISGVLFSNVAVMAPQDGVPKLMFRVISQRRNVMINAQANVMLARTVRTKEGTVMRHFVDLKLERSQVTIWLLTWTLTHRIDETSPLWGLSRDDLLAQETEIILAVCGTDETLAQSVHAYHCYGAEQILWDRRFADIFARTKEGRFSMNFGHLNETLPLSEPA